VAQYDIQLSAEELEFDTILSFPNPANDKLNFMCPSAQVGKPYYISDSNGRLVLSGTTVGLSNSLATSELDSGLYTITILSDLQFFTSTFIKH
jgi:hypothetical protein